MKMVETEFEICLISKPISLPFECLDFINEAPLSIGKLSYLATVRNKMMIDPKV